MALNPFTDDPYQDDKEIVELQTENQSLKALVREMHGFVLLYAAITPNPILEGQARKLLSRNDARAIMEGKDVS